jgi:hypothetical protein
MLEKIFMSRKLIMTYTILLSFLLNSCVGTNAPRGLRSTEDSETVTDGTRTPGSGDGDAAAPYQQDDLGGEDDLAATKVELTQIVDPNTGTFRKKVSIPKDFEGYLYLSGLNVTSLKNKIIQVRFRLGREKTAVTIPAVVGRVPGGLQPLSSLDVIILDVQNKPFRQVRLLYDLFDYNDYQEGDVSPSEPTDDPANPGLYCRGLKVEDDPTFQDNPEDNDPDDDDLYACDEAGDTCLYAYAKIADQVLYRLEENADGNDVLTTRFPMNQMIDVLARGYSEDTNTENLQKCIPDTSDITYLNSVLGTDVQSLTSSFVLGLGENAGQTAFSDEKLFLDGTQYVYRGPYQILSFDDWEVTGGAIFHDVASPTDIPNGVFQTTINPGASFTKENVMGGIRPYLFPRAGKINFSQAGIQYFGSDNAFDTSRTLQTLPAAGDTKWMDGCNIRSKNYDRYSGETISSCNVTATIEVITVTNGIEEVLVSSKDVKLQLLKEGLGVDQGQQFSAMQTCDSNRACGTGECCFNSRCWSRDIVGQCADDFAGQGNRGTGESCSTDFDCASLCCNQTTGVCSDHINNEQEQVLCSKVPGQACVTKEYCRQENVRKCYIITTTDTNGNPSCEKKCFSVQEFGDCINGVCHPPDPEPEPAFDPLDPDRCADAISNPPVVID